MLIFIFFLLKYLFPNYFNSIPKDRKRKVCLVIAHPDDEVMFFSPFLQNLSKFEVENLNVICLTNELTVRADELKKCLAQLLDLKSIECSVHIYDCYDSMTKSCREDYSTDEKLISKIKNLFKQNYNFYTFDEQGVSGHINHKDCFYFLFELLGQLRSKSEIQNRHESFTVSRLYKLKSCNIFKKYFLPLPNKKTEIYNTFSQWRNAYKAFRIGHKSQIRWYRHFWFYFSRYLFCLDFERVY